MPKTMSERTPPGLVGTHDQIASGLVAEMHAHGGLVPMDLEQFWADQNVARANPFGSDIPQVAMGIEMNRECVFAELGLSEDYWRLETGTQWVAQVQKHYNDKAETIVGRRLMPESLPVAPDDRYPDIRRFHDLFEASNKWHDNSWWLQQAVTSEDDLSALLDRVEYRLDNDFRSFVLPPDWDEHKTCLMARGIHPPRYRYQRGPVTFATSLFGAENFIYLILDNPDLAARFRDIILRAMIAFGRLLDNENGDTPQTAPRCFHFYDDNCSLLTPDMYEFWAYPILKGMFDEFAPDLHDWRFQHSDSDMEHLLPILAKLNFSQVNFGPTLAVSSIREYMPATIIEGQLAPYTFMHNEEENIVREFLRDFDQARETRGLLFATAGSVNNGSRLNCLRLIMAAIQRYGRF